MNDLKEELLARKESLQGAIDDINTQLKAIESDIRSHVYPTLAAAEDALMEKFYDEAFEDCEGAGNCGNETYSQDFIVDGVKYRGVGHFEYNRHDKTYYYVDGSEWECVELT